eukprot:jgi/Bigna1/86939/estExt_fgenesh1_pg.C_150116
MTSSSATATSLRDRGVSKWLCDACREMGIQRPTDIQRLAIPAIMKGENVIARAKTGSGKTAAFGLPILDSLSMDPYGIFAYILTPTRELAFQIAEQLNAFGAGMNVRVQVVVGGTDIVKEATKLGRAPHIVVSTPGRLAAHTRDAANLNVKHLKFLVLDEADRLFNDSFDQDLSVIFESLPIPKHRQTLFFSATLTKQINEKASKLCGTKPKFFQINSDEEAQTVSELKQGYIFLPQPLKETYLVHILQEHEEKSVLIFTTTCKGAELLSQVLTQMEIECESLHSGKNQARRLASLAKFRGGQCKILVATDVASRGLDIPQVTLVVNYDLPRTVEDYVQRVGRTARAGRGGLAITLVSQYDVKAFVKIEEHIKLKIEKYNVKEKKALELLKFVSEAKRMAKLRLEEFEMRDESSKLKRKIKKRKRHSVNKKKKSAEDEGGKKS